MKAHDLLNRGLLLFLRSLGIEVSSNPTHYSSTAHIIAPYTYIYYSSFLKDLYYLRMASSSCDIQGRFLMEKMKFSLENITFALACENIHALPSKKVRPSFDPCL